MVIEILSLVVAFGIGVAVGLESQAPRIKRMTAEINNVWGRFFDEESAHFETKNQLLQAQTRANKKKAPQVA